MRIRDILHVKGRDVVTISPDHTVMGAVKVLVEHSIGAVVVEDHDDIRGIFSERDVMRLATGGTAALRDTRISDVMTTDLVVGVEDDDVDYVMEIMTRNRIRHLPIVDEDGALTGLVSIGDVVNALRREMEAENRYLRDYIAGVAV
jgi:CBS domain-containing protein